jgi:hypothetical protein
MFVYFRLFTLNVCADIDCSLGGSSIHPQVDPDVPTVATPAPGRPLPLSLRFAFLSCRSPLFSSSRLHAWGSACTCTLHHSRTPRRAPSRSQRPPQWRGCRCCRCCRCCRRWRRSGPPVEVAAAVHADARGSRHKRSWDLQMSAQVWLSIRATSRTNSIELRETSQ